MKNKVLLHTRQRRVICDEDIITLIRIVILLHARPRQVLHVFLLDDRVVKPPHWIWIEVMDQRVEEHKLLVYQMCFKDAVEAVLLPFRILNLLLPRVVLQNCHRRGDDLIQRERRQCDVVHLHNRAL